MHIDGSTGREIDYERVERDKRRFRTLTLLLVIYGLLYMGGLVYVFSFFLHKNKDSISIGSMESAIVRDGVLYYTKNPVDNMGKEVYRVELSGSFREKKIGKVRGWGGGFVWIDKSVLLVTNAGLWKIENDRPVNLGYHDFDKVGIPFDFDKPGALCQRKDGSIWLFSFNGNGISTGNPARLEISYIDNGKKKIKDLSEIKNFLSDVQIIRVKDNYYTFAALGNSLYVLEGLPYKSRKAEEWKKLGECNFYFKAMNYFGKPYAAALSRIGNFNKAPYIWYKKSGEKWEESSKTFIGNPVLFKVVEDPVGEAQYTFMMNEDYYWQIFESDCATTKLIYENKNTLFAFARHLLIFIIVFRLPAPFIFAVFLSFLEKRWNVPEPLSEKRRIVPASLYKRVIARIIDEAMLMAPRIAITFFVGSIFTRGYSDFFDWLTVLKVWLFSIQISLFFRAAFFIAAEAKYGRTPGKGIVGIRVIDSDVSGIIKKISPAQAFWRNFFLIFDTAAGFLPGLAVIFWTRESQRMGDQVSGTLVVEDASRIKRLFRVKENIQPLKKQ